METNREENSVGERQVLEGQPRALDGRMEDCVFRVLEYARAYSTSLFLDGIFETRGSVGFTFVDLFAGIGGFRLGLQSVGGKCVFSSECDKWCRKTYAENFGEKPYGDIRQLDEDEIPDHNVLAAGFPCQPFSIAGVSKKQSLGREHGFSDQTHGTLFFDVVRILDAKEPEMFLLENVKNLKSHDGGKTFEVIKGALKELGYSVFHRVIDARYWVPQHRERIFLVGMHETAFAEDMRFEFPEVPDNEPKLGSIVDDDVDEKYTLSDKLWSFLQDYAEKHRKRGNGFGYGLCDKNSVARTLSARYYKDGSEILLDQGPGKNPRRLTPRECARLMGFPDDFAIPVSDTQAYKQFGNSVAVPVVKAIAKNIADVTLGTKSNCTEGDLDKQDASNRISSR